MVRSPKLRWFRLIVAATAVAFASGLIAFAASIDVRRPLQLASAVEDDLRRASNERSDGPSYEAPLERLSRIHVAAPAFASVRGPGVTIRDARVRVVIDTGASTVFGTAHGGARFPVRTAPGVLGARSFHGESGALYPIENEQVLSLSLTTENSPAHVQTRVPYLAPATLYGVEFIAPPQVLAPKGGAVLIDLQRDVLSVCESLQDCRRGASFEDLELEACAAQPELLGVRVQVEGKMAKLLVDTGAATLLFKGFYESAKLASFEQSREPGKLIGLSGQAPDSVLVHGSWTFRLGRTRSLERTARRLWVVTPSERGVSHCFADGSIGLDLIDGCKLLLEDTIPRRGALHCPEPAAHD